MMLCFRLPYFAWGSFFISQFISFSLQLATFRPDHTITEEATGRTGRSLPIPKTHEDKYLWPGSPRSHKSLKRSYRQPSNVWPSGLIPVCYKDSRSKAKLDRLFKEALSLWKSSFERDFGPDSWPIQVQWLGVAVSEVESQILTAKGEPHCNPASIQVIYIEWTPESRWFSDLGFQHGGPTNMILSTNTMSALQKIVHEIGHGFFALRHEHQRPDAAVYLKSTCQRLRDFQSTVSQQEEPWIKDGHEPGWVVDKVCPNSTLAKEIGFSAWNLAPDPHDSGVVDGPFDFDSVMIYGSFTGGDWVLERVHEVGLGGRLTKFIQRNVIPSRGDTRQIFQQYADINKAKRLR